MAETSRDRLVRMLGMVAYLESHGATPVAVLAEHFGVSQAKVTQELWTLGMSGVPPYLPDEYLDFDFDALDEGLAVLRDAQGVTQVRLSGQEAVALTGALATLIAAGTAPEGAVDLLERIRVAFGGAAPVTVLPGGDTVDPALRDTLAGAITRGHAVRADYVDAQDHRTERVIEPHRLVAIDGIGYVECWCRKAQGYRTLRLSRFADAEELADAATQPASAEHGFSLEPQYNATVTMRRSARWAFEDIAGVAVEDDGDSATATFGVSDTGWAAARLLTVAPHLLRVEPVTLREELARHAGAVIAAQGD
ncbi:helix-turn-helix transcriptional regulator [Demequina activiva]|uniref:Protein pafC n=1 Tax=Demequina activiva TaxID=1582364 RepID=A0A919Q5E0_9MICO|nr:WYL domain-containing protein [Demequina activiva]GIG54588.1 protein pafC [Demequina activiva]